MKRIFFAIFAALLGFTGVSAQVEFKDIEFTADSPASVELGMGINYFTFTAPEDGAVEFHVGWTSTMVYITDEAGTEDTKVLLAKDADENGYIYRMTVEAGRKYYVSTSIVTDPLTMTVGYASEVDAIKLSANYDDGDVFNMIGSNLEITIDRQVSIDRTLVVLPDGSEEDVPADCINAIFVTQYYYTIMLRDLMDYLMDGGKIAVGDKFTIRLEGIADARPTAPPSTPTIPRAARTASSCSPSPSRSTKTRQASTFSSRGATRRPALTRNTTPTSPSRAAQSPLTSAAYAYPKRWRAAAA